MPILEQTLYSGQISEGEPVVRFEEEFRQHFSLPLCRSFSSATAALHTALILAGVRPGDEVISTPLTVEPTNMAIRHAGARIVWADVDFANGNILPTSIEERISERTQAIMIVHYAGVPVRLKEIGEIAARHGVPVIEDAAHALGARYNETFIGTHGNYTVFSFQAIKHFTTMDGGMLVLRDAAEDGRARKIRWFGIDRTQPRIEQRIAEVGYKYHMTNVPATIGLVQLRFIDAILERHRTNGRYYDKELKGIDGVELCSWETCAEPSYWIYTIKVERRDDFSRAMKERGIETGIGSLRNDAHPVFGEASICMPGVDDFASRMVHIPCGWWVGDEERARIIDAVKKGW